MSMLSSVMAELKAKGNEKTMATYERHGAPAGRAMGVSVADLKTVAKKLKGQQELACELYDTGMIEAMYLAGMIADGKRMSRSQLQHWAEAAEMSMISEYTVPWVTLENAEGRALALEWMQAKEDHIKAAGWCTYSGIVAVTADDKLDLQEIEKLLHTVEQKIDAADDREKYTMNGFVISVGSYVLPAMERARAAAAKIGKLTIDMGDTACKVPLATDYIAKVEAMGRAGRKRKTIRC